MLISSPWVSETGRSMSTKKSWKTRMPRVAEPSRPSWVEARAVSRQVVMLSAMGISSDTKPPSSVRTSGAQYRVSGKYWRSRGGSSAPAVSFPFSISAAGAAVGAASMPSSLRESPIGSVAAPQPVRKSSTSASVASADRAPMPVPSLPNRRWAWIQRPCPNKR